MRFLFSQNLAYAKFRENKTLAKDSEFTAMTISDLKIRARNKNGFLMHNQNKKEGKDQESIQSSTTYDPYVIPYGKVTKTQENTTHKHVTARLQGVD